MKRWTGGEFCSAAHQKQYKEEYNQLALGRLLQAQPGDVSKPAEVPEPAAALMPTAVHVLAADVPTASVSADGAAEHDPSSTGFIVELPPAARVGGIPPESPDTAPVWQSLLSLPIRPFEIREAQISSNAVVERSIQIVDYATRRNDRGLDVREFTRNSPVFGFGLAMAQATGLEKCKEPLEAAYFPYPPPASPTPWQAPERNFDTSGTELGVLARIAFRPTGIQDEEDREHERTDPKTGELNAQGESHAEG